MKSEQEKTEVFCNCNDRIASTRGRPFAVTAGKKLSKSFGREGEPTRIFVKAGG
jgi:hypothetical protein